MGTHTLECRLQQEFSGEEEASAQPVGFFLMLDVAGEELQISDPLNGAHLVIEQHVCELVRLIAADSAFRPERVEPE